MDNYKKLGNGMPDSLIATIFTLVGVALMGIGILAGTLLGSDGLFFSFPIFLMYSFSGIFSGLLFIGFGEVIKLLLYINIRLHRKGYTLVDKAADNQDKVS